MSLTDPLPDGRERNSPLQDEADSNAFMGLLMQTGGRG